MKSLITLYSEKKDLVLTFNSESQEIVKALFKLLALFSEIKNSNYNLKILQKKTADLYNRIDTFTESYKDDSNNFLKLRSFIKDLEDNEWFYIIPLSIQNLDKTIEIKTSLELLNQGYAIEDIDEMINERKKKYNELFCNVLKNYEIISFPSDKKIFIGEPNKRKRKCRFCKRTMEEGASFKNVAHSIPESLGNKKIINNEECDECNDKFGKEIEVNLIQWLDIFRVFWGVKGKRKIPKIKFKDGNSFTYENGNPTIKYVIDSETKVENEPTEIILNPFDNINYNNVYRSLCKITIGIIDSKLLKHFEKTIKWINNEITINKDDKLPKVAHLIIPTKYFDQPEITLYIRKNENIKLPFVVSEFKIFSFVYVFIIPFCNKDKQKFVTKKEYDFFWAIFKHYHSFKNWSFQDLSIDEEKERLIKLNFQKRV